jgi:UDP-N-acetyl-2-amino-2-deoxyglucuronate dehydrogenase
MSNFALTGVAGYVAPRHVRAIRETGNALVAAFDPHDSVGMLDGYFPDCAYFSEFERFDRHLEKLRRGDEANRVQYLSICSPNYLHDAHIRFGLRIGADVICEKPLVLNPWNLDALATFEEETQRRIYSVLQLRHHPAFLALKQQCTKETGKRRKVTLTYITPRGLWYQHSWKGVPAKSGGLATNIGIHFFDLLIWLFGSVEDAELHHADAERVSGAFVLQNADVTWYLSVSRADSDAPSLHGGVQRSLSVDDIAVDFSAGFEDLHVEVYRSILNGGGFGIADARPAIEAGYHIRHAVPTLGVLDHHPLLLKRKELIRPLQKIF